MGWQPGTSFPLAFKGVRASLCLPVKPLPSNDRFSQQQASHLPGRLRLSHDPFLGTR